MKTRQLLLTIVFLCVGTVAGATTPTAMPEVISENRNTEIPTVTDKAFGDPTDLKAAAIAAADYVRYMQADITEDNAGNGAVDADPDDAGWDWALAPFEHSGSASATNIYGSTAMGLLRVYALNPDPALFTAMQDAADHIVAEGPVSIRSAFDVVFLLDFAELSGVVDPAIYQQGAADIWDYRLATYTSGQTATEYAAWLRDLRGVAHSYPNGIIPWDTAPWATGLMKLDAVFPAPAMYASYAAQAAEIAEVLYQDSFALAPGLFDVHGRNKGYDPTWVNQDYWWYTLGVSGLIEAFAVTGTHTAEIAALETILLESQYSDGAFSDQYGAPTDINDRTWQGTAYAAVALHLYVPATPSNQAALYSAGTWLGASQDASGGFIYSSGNHYPQIGGECAAGLAAAYSAGAAAVSTTTTFPNPAQCGATGEVVFYYDRNAATPGLYGYEMVVAISNHFSPIVSGDFVPVAPMDFFRVDDNLDGTFTVNASRFGADPGLMVDSELFLIDLTTAAEGSATVSVVSYRMRDPQNVPMFVDTFGMAFAVDCTVPLPVANITAAPGHNKVDVSWVHNGDDTIAYEVYRGLRYVTTVGNSAYPEYNDISDNNTIPTRPSNRDVAVASAEWEYAGAVLVGSNTFTDVGAAQVGGGTFDPAGGDRGIYYYEVFAVDAAINTSVAAPANDRATNYWLGDVSPMDGEVYVDDITALGTAFATNEGDLAYNAFVDVGPTDTASPMGIPTCDDLIDFEDLMIFALNFGEVSPAKAKAPISNIVELAWVKRDDNRWALHLVSGSGLQGLHVSASLPEGSIASVEAGALITSQGLDVFLINSGTRLDVNLALLGRNASFVGSGEIFVVDSPVQINAADLIIDARGNDNSHIETTLDQLSGVNTPVVFQLSTNYPNPFNPMTKINFSLPSTQSVELVVYSLDGRRVATLLNETRAAGHHDVVWMGRDSAGRAVSSGTYFYRLNAGPYSQVRKMTLMK